MLGGKKRRHNVANTIIGIDTRINGDLHFAGGLHVDGMIAGSVSADPDSKAALSLASGATIDASDSMMKFMGSVLRGKAGLTRQ